MTAQILLSQITAAGIPDYGAAVRHYRDAMINHLGTVNKPQPTAPDIVKAAIRRIPVSIDQPDEFHIDYEIIDDTPVSPVVQLLRETIGA